MKIIYLILLIESVVDLCLAVANRNFSGICGWFVVIVLLLIKKEIFRF